MFLETFWEFAIFMIILLFLMTKLPPVNQMDNVLMSLPFWMTNETFFNEKFAISQNKLPFFTTNLQILKQIHHFHNNIAIICSKYALHLRHIPYIYDKLENTMTYLHFTWEIYHFEHEYAIFYNSNLYYLSGMEHTTKLSYFYISKFPIF